MTTNGVAAERLRWHCRSMVAVLAHIRDIEEWLGQGWQVAMVPVHPVQRAYGRCWVWRVA